MNKTKTNMIPIFETNFILTREMNKKYARYTYSLMHIKWQMITLIISILLFTASFVMVFLKLPILFVIFLLMGLYVFFMSWFGYLFQARVSYNDMARFYGDPIQMHLIFYPDFFRVVGDDTNFDFLYSQVTNIIELSDMTILIVSGKGIITHGQVIDKQSLSDEDLRKFHQIIYDKIDIKKHN